MAELMNAPPIHSPTNGLVVLPPPPSPPPPPPPGPPARADVDIANTRDSRPGIAQFISRMDRLCRFGKDVRPEDGGGASRSSPVRSRKGPRCPPEGPLVEPASHRPCPSRRR